MLARRVALRRDAGSSSELGAGRQLTRALELVERQEEALVGQLPDAAAQLIVHAEQLLELLAFKPAIEHQKNNYQQRVETISSC